MRVLSFSYCFPTASRPTWGIFVAQRLAALAELADVKVVTPVPIFPFISRLRGHLGPRRDEVMGLEVNRPRFFYLPGVMKSCDGRFYARGLRRWLRRQCEQWRPDVLDAHFIWPDGVGVSMLAREMGIPYTITLRGQIHPCAEDARRSQCQAALAGASAIISLSDQMSAAARDMGAPADRITLIPNGVDTDHFRPRDKADARRKLKLPDEGRIIVTVAHLGHRKGHHEMLRALAKLPDDIRLVLVGGDTSGGKDTASLRSLIDELDLTGRVTITGPQPYESIPLYFNAADVSVLASYREGCPNVVLESLASGTPVVAADVGTAAEMITCADHGRIVPPQQVAPLVDALGEVLSAPPAPEAVLAADAVKPWSQIAQQVHSVLKNVVASQPALTQESE